MRRLIGSGKGRDGTAGVAGHRRSGNLSIVHRTLPGGSGRRSGGRLGGGSRLLGLLLGGETGLAVLEEGHGHLGEGDVAQHVLVALGGGAQLLLGLLELGLQAVGEAALHQGGVAQDLLLDGGINGSGSTAVLAAAVSLDLLADHLVALAGQHVLHSLRANHLAGGGNQRRIAHILADLGSLFQHLVQLVDGVHHLQLGDEVGQHAAGDLVVEALGISGHGDGIQSAALEEVGPDALKEVGHLGQGLVVQVNLIAHLTDGVGHGLGGGLRGAAGEGRNGSIQHVGAGLHSLELGHVGQTGGAVGVDDQGQLRHGVLDGGNQVVGLLGAHQAGHVLDADGLYAHALQVLDHLHVVLQGVHGAGGVGDGTGGVSALLDGLINGHFQVAHVVEGVENTDDIDTVLHGVLDKLTYHIVGIVLIAQDVLAAQQHLQLGVGHLGADLAQTLPGIFPQVTQTHVKGGAAPDLGGVETSLIHGLQDGLKLAVGKPGGDQRLIRVTQHSFRKLDLSHSESTSMLLVSQFAGLLAFKPDK